ncbi:MAG: hypothetical protein Q6361_01350, partial [Candidatus Hermodarchaeota archaeon]|nr:hypothetical protein [Candidatus Hermodarchaeota archaeon]
YHEFRPRHRFRFTQARRYEIDIIAMRQPYLLCIDCKQFGARWGKASVLRSACEKQLVRSQALADHLDRYQVDLGILDWQEPVLLPVLVTMMLEDIQFHENTPIVPAANLNAFLLKFEDQVDWLQKVKPCGGRQTKLC